MGYGQSRGNWGGKFPEFPGCERWETEGTLLLVVRVYLSLGSNLGDSGRPLKEGVQLLLHCSLCATRWGRGRG